MFSTKTLFFNIHFVVNIYLKPEGTPTQTQSIPSLNGQMREILV